MKRILFQGDSITDCGRNGENGSLCEIGQGYALMVAGELGVRDPGKYEFVNRGISGNKVVDVYARIKKDIWNLKPDIISVLLGVNDVWHDIEFQNGVDAERFERVYSMLIEDTLKALPGVEFILMEPFVLPGRSTDEKWEIFEKEVALRGKSVKKLSEKYNTKFVPLQERFNELCDVCEPSYWLGDGVHPTVAGHGIIKQEWIKVFDKQI